VSTVARARRPLPDYVEQEFEAYRKCGRLEAGFLLRRAGLTRTTGHTGAVRLVQRFGSALNLNVHFHMLFPDGAHRTEGVAAPVFRAACEPRAQELQGLAGRIALRIGRTLEQCGLIERDIERSCSRCRRCRGGRPGGWVLAARRGRDRSGRARPARAGPLRRVQGAGMFGRGRALGEHISSRRAVRRRRAGP
jgi:hypothetical protein